MGLQFVHPVDCLEVLGAEMVRVCPAVFEWSSLDSPRLAQSCIAPRTQELLAGRRTGRELRTRKEGPARNEANNSYASRDEGVRNGGDSRSLSDKVFLNVQESFVVLGVLLLFVAEEHIRKEGFMPCAQWFFFRTSDADSSFASTGVHSISICSEVEA